MALKLYGAALSPFVRKTRVFLIEKGIEFEAVHVDPNSPPEDYARLNPLKRIPAMEDGDKVLADSAVICAYLERKHPEPSLYPDDDYEYARALWFEKYADYEIAMNCTFAIFRNRVVMRLLGKECDEDKVQKALTEKLPPLMDYLEREIEGKTFLAGDKLTVADIAMASQFVNLQHGGETVDQSRWPNMAAYIGRLHERPAFHQQIEKESGFVRKVIGQD